MSDQPEADTTIRQHKTLKLSHHTPQAGSEPAVPASDLPQTHDLDRAATGTGY
jgi:hypothetical protein